MTMQAKNGQAGSRRRAGRAGLVRPGLLTLAVVAVVAAVGVGAMLVRQHDAQGSMTAPGGAAVFAAQRGPLVINVSEAGTIKAREQEVLKSEVEGQTTIISLVPEGKMVEEGELLVELDASRLRDERVNQEISVQNAEASFIRARENLAVTRNQAESDIAKAQLDYRFAQEDLRQYLDGEYPKQLKEAQSRITLALEDMERASEKYAWSQKLFEEKYISQSELEADRLTMKRAELDHELAVTNLDLLENYTYTRRVAELESQVDQTRRALERVERKATADVVQAEADLKAKESEFTRQQDKFRKIEEQIAKARIVAPTSGMVIYATSARGNRWGNAEPLAEGQQVRERQELIHLPTAASMMAEIKLHESALNKVKAGMPVRVAVDALPGKTFTGVVAKIAPLPDAQSVWLNPDLTVYGTQINITGDTEGLRTGMSCRAEIVVERLPDALFVPVQSVVRVSGQPMVYLPQAGGGLEARPVEIGLDNNRMVHIRSGLQAGELVLLAPPLAAPAQAAEIAQDEPAQDSPQAAGEPSAPNAESPAAPAGPTAEATAAAPAAQPQPDAGQGEQAAAGQREQMRRQFENMTPEQRDALRRQVESLTPEQREQLRQRFMGGNQ